MTTDTQGNALSGASADAAALYDGALHAFNLFRGDPVALLDEALALAPEFAMASIAKAHLLVTSSEPAAISEAGVLLDLARKLPLNEREAAHVGALETLLRGEWSGAALALDRLSLRYPHDILALQSGHLLDFYCADSRNLRDRIARVLPLWSTDIPAYSIVLGMYAFGLEECRDFERAEDTGREALARQPLDCWAHHAVTHVMEMQGRPEDGIGWMIAREPHWTGDDNLFKVHNWWHRALFHLELEQAEEALALYDGPLRENRSAVALDLVDASALLWRLQMSGVDVGQRWDEVATAWEAHADGGTYPFNDWHAAMALLGAQRDEDVERLIASLRESAAGDSQVNRWTREIGLPLVTGFATFARGDYRAAAETLYGVRHIAGAFGGSHAQRDIIDWTLAEAALRGGETELAQALVNERLAHKPRSRLSTGLLSRARALAAATPGPLRSVPAA